MLKFLKDNEIQKIYQMNDAISDIKKVLYELNNQKIINKERTVIKIPNTDNTMLYMPCIDISNKYSIIKTISIFPENKHLPVSQGITLLTELDTGNHVATMESSYLTRLRTGAMSAIATDYLSDKNATSLAVIGTGGMAFEQVLGVLEVRKISHIYLYNRTIEKAEAFKNSLEKLSPNIKIIVCNNSSEAVKNADIINCATKSEVSVFNSNDLKERVHINGVGSYLPSMREIDIEAIKNAELVVIDDLDGAKEEAGEFIHAEKENKFNFEDAIELRNIEEYKNSSSGITIFKSVGAAYYDLAVTVGVYNKQLETE